MVPNNAEPTQRLPKPTSPMTKAALDLPRLVFNGGKIDRVATLDAQAICAASLFVELGRDAKAEYPLHEGPNLIGRLGDDLIDIDIARHEAPEQTYSSRKHAYVIFADQALFIVDCYSRNGTSVNGQPIQAGEQQRLRLGDTIQIGAVQLRVRGRTS